MSAFRKRFANRHTFLPVVHAETREQVLRNVGMAMENGADGVFLINHHIPVTKLIGCYAAATAEFPKVWIGLNILGHTALDGMIRLPGDVGGFWADNAGVSSTAEDEAVQFGEYRTSRKGKWLYFGGVAFKGQEYEPDPVNAARRAMSFMDVVTTSGKQTASAPEIDKIVAMKHAIGDHPLAIASGISPENVHLFMPHADCFLVASSICAQGSFTEFDPTRVRAFADKLNARMGGTD